MLATRLCERCGYDLPTGAGRCECHAPLAAPVRAARQVAGIDLPTRSVHPLRTLRAVREQPARRPLRRPSWAADLLSYTLLLALMAATTRLAAVVAHTDRFSTQLAPITLDRLDRAVTLLLWATAIAAALTLAAVASLIARLVARHAHPEPTPAR